MARALLFLSVLGRKWSANASARTDASLESRIAPSPFQMGLRAAAAAVTPRLRVRNGCASGRDYLPFVARQLTHPFMSHLELYKSFLDMLLSNIWS